MHEDGHEIIIRTNELGKTYYRRAAEPVVALEDATFSIRQGEFVSLVGPSGCGKSTILNILGGLIPRTEGSATFRGQETLKPRPEIGMMFQAPVLFPWRTTLQNVLLPIDVRKENRKDYVDRARELLALTGLSAFENSYPRELSGGMQQRAALSRLLLQDPEVMLLDEPFGALDEFTRESMNMELLDIWGGSGKTMLLVTHNIQEAVFLADRVFVMTPRPGTLARVLEVPLPRPRQIPMMKRQEFTDMVFEARVLLNAT
ncbi:MAG: ATP-binding cassette domain-containing protein [Dehalococcoidia bacterium]|nr:ATP-binding cassette domain-containing protein [Dehalococcoidia bacterium]